MGELANRLDDGYRCKTRSIRLNGQSTSIRLEEVFWRILDNIAQSENLSTPRFISKQHSKVMSLCGEAGNFTSLLRCMCLIHVDPQQSDQPLHSAAKESKESD